MLPVACYPRTSYLSEAIALKMSSELTTYSVSILYPDQSTFNCPACQLAFNLYSSLTRHFSTKHKDSNFDLSFTCSECSETFASKRSCSCHFTKRHPTEGSKTAARQGSHQCDFCTESFASKRSLAQHTRGAHAAEKSAALAAEIAERGTRYWTEEEHEQFLDALFQVGPLSNIEIANLLPNKTAAQINSHKYKFLRKHPNWREDFAAGRKTRGADTTGSDIESTRGVDEPERSDDELI